MCGLVGCAGSKLEFKHEKAFKELLIVDTIRGPHSTGIMAAHANGNISVFKKALLPPELFSMKGCADIFAKLNRVLIGHNRWATQGAINGVNAHPFEFETLVGAHNGTLVNQKLLPDHTQFTVDSENIFHSIQKIGLKDTVASLNGAYALTWYDKEKKTVNMIRNKERPLFVTFTEDNTVMFWASESWMLSGVLAKNGIGHGEVYDTSVHTHYEFKIPTGVIHKPETWEFAKPTQKVLEPWKAPYNPKPKNQTTIGTVVNGRFMKNNGEKDRKGNGNTGTTTTQSSSVGWEFEVGEEIYFYLDPDSPRDKNFIYGLFAHNTSKKVKIYCRRNSWLRSNLDCDDVDDVVYLANVNGLYMGGVTIQSNSVYVLAEDDETEEEKAVKDLSNIEMDNAIAAASAMDPSKRNDQIMALQATKGTCSWCGDPITPNIEHIYVDSNTIICHVCKDTDKLVKDYLGEMQIEF